MCTLYTEYETILGSLQVEVFLSETLRKKETTGKERNLRDLYIVILYMLLVAIILLTMDRLLEFIVILYYTVFVREQFSADCETLHGYHSMDSSWSYAKAHADVASIVHSFHKNNAFRIHDSDR